MSTIALGVNCLLSLSCIVFGCGNMFAQGTRFWKKNLLLIMAGVLIFVVDVLKVS